MDYYSAAAVPSQLSTLPVTAEGVDAIRKTLRDMVAIVRKYRSDAGVGAVARQILIAGGVRDARAQKQLAILLIQNFVRDHIVYVPDPRDVEMLQTPPRTLQIGTGDCDDKAILVATMLETLGFSTRFMAVGGTGAEWADGGDEWCGSGKPPYSHVLAQVRVGSGHWVCLETIVSSAQPGWCPKGIQVLMVAHV